MKTAQIFSQLFIELPQNFHSIFLGISENAEEMLCVCYTLQEICHADNDEEREQAMMEFVAASLALRSLAVEVPATAGIDLSDPDRFSIFEAVKQGFLSRLLLSVPDMPPANVDRFIDANVEFLRVFNETGTRELEHHARALARA